MARALGVSENFVELLRLTRCDPDADFSHHEGATVFTEVGEKKLRALVDELMRSQPPDALAVSVTKAAPIVESPPLREDLRLTRVFRWSDNILAELPNGREVTVTVRTNRHLEPGMVLRGCIKGQLGWTYQGRLPRTLGERQLYFP